MMIFYGFYRILPITPAPVIALFSDEERIFAQRSIDEKTVTSYEEVFNIDKDRIFVKKDLNVPAPELGQELVLAYEIHKGSVAIGNKNILRERVNQLILNASGPKLNDFACLEAASFTENHDLIKRFAARCFEKLNKRSNELSAKWLEGAPLAEDVKKSIAEKYLYSGDKVVLRSKGFRISLLDIIIVYIDFLAKSASVDRNTFLTLCIRNTDKKYGQSIAGEFLGQGYKMIDREINNSFSKYYSRSRDLIKNIITNDISAFEHGGNKKADTLATLVIEHDLTFAFRLTNARPSIRLGDIEFRLLRDILDRTVKQSERSKAAFLIFCVSENIQNFYEGLIEFQERNFLSRPFNARERLLQLFSGHSEIVKS